jgi:carbon-monoxide dehydrogenase large subunit
MNIHVDDERLAVAKFGVGQPVRRSEDPVLVQGRGAYTDDVNLPRQAHAAILRSSYAHGRIRGIDTTAAAAMPGVLAVYTGADLAAAGYGPIVCKQPFVNRDGSPMLKPPRPALSTDKVRFVGDPIACVVAETEAQAYDAAEAIEVDIEPLPAIIEARDAVEAGAPRVFDEVPENVALDWHFGDSAKVAEAFAVAAHVTKLRLINNRIVVNAMEPRAAVADYDEQIGRFTLYAPTQSVLGSRATAAEMMKVPPTALRFVSRNVGGSFGMKGAIFPEYICAMHAARELGRPIKWTDRRSDSFVSDHHGRDLDFDAELALDKDGHFLAVRADGFANLGGYLTAIGPLIPTVNIVKHTNSCYRTPLIEVNTRCVFTNTVPTTAYRGAGRPEGNYIMERLIDTAAAEMGIDPAELRRRNHIAPSEMPYKAPSGMTYDTGDFSALLDEALEIAEWDDFEKRRSKSAANGKIRGRGIGQFLEVTAPVMKELAGLRFNGDGTVTIATGTHDHGQGHGTSFAQVLVEKLGVPFERIRIMQTDSDQLVAGGGTGGSKSLMSSGTAIAGASLRVIETGKLIASHLLEAGVGDIAFDAGRFGIAGTDRGISIMDMAAQLAAGVALPEDCPKTLDIDYVHESAPATFPNGCHICEVEIDPETGVVEVVKYTMVGDFGTLVNPMIVEGQLQGGVVQGIGQCLLERTVYSDEGQLASGSFMDYAMPHADNAPMFVFANHPVPAKTNPLGVKGCGEAGCAGSMTSVMNAVVDALSAYDIRHIDMPATPQRVWKAIRERQN